MRKKRGRIPKMPGRRLSPARQLLLGLLFGGLLGGLAILWLNCRLRPMVLAASESALSNRVAEIVGEALEASEPDYAGLLQLRYDQEGRLTAVTAELSSANRLKSALGGAILDAFSGEQRETVSVPCGSLTGLTLLSGRGLAIPVQVIGVAQYSSRLESRLTHTGINQTLYQLELVADTQLVLLLPGGPAVQTVTSRIALAETVLLGEVPDNYTYFSQFDNAEDAANAYFDYGAGAE